MNQQAEQVKKHFHKTAHKFDAIYTGEKSAFGKLLDKRFRWDMRERLKMTLDACQPIGGKRILDAGCGTGRFCFPLAERGADVVVGIDFAESMITEAKRLAEEKQLAHVCQFECLDIMDFEPEVPFDYSIAVGVFDYIKDGRHVMQKLRQLTKGKAIMTFPRADTWRALLRKIRLSILGCPVYFYTKKRVEDHLMIAGFSVTKMVKVGKLYFVEAI